MNLSLLFAGLGIILAALSYVWPQLLGAGAIFIGIAVIIPAR